LRTLCAFSNIL